MHLGKLAFELLGRGTSPSPLILRQQRAPWQPPPSYSSIRTRTNSDTEEPPAAATASNLPRVSGSNRTRSSVRAILLSVYVHLRTQYIVPQARRAELSPRRNTREALMPYSLKHAREASGILAGPEKTVRNRVSNI